MTISLAQMQKVCERRLEHITALYGPRHGADWTANDWFTALAGEVGELGNLFKKKRRGDFLPFTAVDDNSMSNALREEVMHEMGDVLAYFLYLCNYVQVDAGCAFVDKFNIVGQRLRLPDRLDYEGNYITEVNKE